MGTNLFYALLLSAGAGLATTIGSFFSLLIKKPSAKFLSFSLGFSAGVMILVSFMELLQNGIKSIGFLSAHLAFFVGMSLMLFIDFLIPHEYIGQIDHKKSELTKTGLLVALGIAIHNFPEGMATFIGALQNIKLGVSISIAIAIHNIPEGFAVSVPVFAATGSRSKAFWWSFLSGVSEPIGAILAALFLVNFLTETTLGWVMSGVAGIMIFISLDELVPASKSYGEEHLPIFGCILGMFIMALSLWMLR